MKEAQLAIYEDNNYLMKYIQSKIELLSIKTLAVFFNGLF